MFYTALELDETGLSRAYTCDKTKTKLKLNLKLKNSSYICNKKRNFLVVSQV